MKKFLLAFGLLVMFQATTYAQFTPGIVPPTTPTSQNNPIGQIIGQGRDIATQVGTGISEINGIIGIFSGSIEEAEEAICKIGGKCKAIPEGRFELPSPDKFNTIGENVSLRQYILNVLNFVLSFLGIIAVAALVYAGFLYVTSGGDDSANEKGKKILIYAVIGILLILASFAIVNTVIRNAGVGTDDRNGISNVNDTGSNANTTNIGDTTPGDPSVYDLRNSLVNPIIIEANGSQDGGDTIFVSLENARQGVQVGLAVEAYAIVDFGDGTRLQIDTSVNPNLRIPYQYGQAGTYTIRAVVQTIDGQLSSFQKQLVVGGLTAQIRGPQQDVLVNTSVNLSAAGSTNQKGTIVSYAWSCGTCSFSANSAAETTATFTAPGAQEVSLEITNSLGQSTTTSTTYNVVGDMPTASFSGESTSVDNRPSEFRFDAGDSLNIKGESRGLTYHWDFEGITRQTSSDQIIYQFPEAGSATVELYVSENFNGQTLESETVSQTFQIPSTLSVDFDVY